MLIHAPPCRRRCASLLHRTALHHRSPCTGLAPAPLAARQVDAFLRENLEWLKKATNWAKFSATAGAPGWRRHMHRF